MKNTILIPVSILLAVTFLKGQDTLVFSGTVLITKEFYKTKVLIFEDGVRISTSGANKIKIECEKSFVGNRCQILGDGRDGNPGRDGRSGIEGDRARDATESGGIGGAGESGGYGTNLEIDFGIIQQLGSIYIDVHGGKGGRGGNGGRGGKGGDADCSDRGGQGARGGDAGTGGKGGNGGIVTIKYCFSKGIIPIFKQTDKNSGLISVNYSGGASDGAGNPGSGGKGGASKDGCGVKYFEYSKGAGRDGQAGGVGTSLGNGVDGDLVIDAFDCRIMAPTKRIALVLANSEYKNNSIDFPIIECPKYDYESILKSLNILGFESSNIIGGLNLTSGKMREKIEAFNKLIIENPNCTSFVYYTGHGFEYKNGNYLAPIDVEPRKKKHREQKIIDNSIELSEITNILGNNGGLNLILLDACRIKKFNALSLGKYFVINNLPKETLVYFATSSGSEAWGCNESLKSSKFTSAFLKQMQIKGQEFGDIVKATNEEVKEQNPELRGNTTKSFYFNQ